MSCLARERLLPALACALALLLAGCGEPAPPAPQPQAAAQARGGAPPAAPEPAQDAPSGSQPAELAEAAAAAQLEALGAALAARNPSQVRIWAAELMASLGGPARAGSVPLLLGVLEPDADPGLLVAAAHSLAALRAEPALPALRELLDHPDPEVRSAAQQALEALQ